MKPFCVALVISCFATLAGAATWLVDQGGSGDFLTIQEAINAASDGDLILVRPGTYVEEIDYTAKMLRIESTDGPGSTTIDGGNQAAVTVASGEMAGTALVGLL